jgi:hypothetical protein
MGSLALRLRGLRQAQPEWVERAAFTQGVIVAAFVMQAYSPLMWKLLVSCSLAISIAISAPSSFAAPSHEVTVCQVATEPTEFEGRLVELVGFWRQDIEIAYLVDPTCKQQWIIIPNDIQDIDRVGPIRLQSKEVMLPKVRLQGRIQLIPPLPGGKQPFISLKQGKVLASE